MSPLANYHHVIGRITVAAAALEDVAIGGVLTLFDGDDAAVRQEHKRILYAGLERNLKALKRSVKDHYSEPYRGSLLKGIGDADRLRRRRNENVHGTWFVWSDGRVQRSRYEGDKRQGVAWDMATPTLVELEQLADGLEECVRCLAAEMEKAWCLDEKAVKRRDAILTRLSRGSPIPTRRRGRSLLKPSDWAMDWLKRLRAAMAVSYMRVSKPGRRGLPRRRRKG